MKRYAKVGDRVEITCAVEVVAVPDTMDYDDTVTVRFADSLHLAQVPASYLRPLTGQCKNCGHGEHDHYTDECHAYCCPCVNYESAGQVVPQQPTCEHGFTSMHGPVFKGSRMDKHATCPGPVGQDTTGLPSDWDLAELATCATCGAEITRSSSEWFHIETSDWDQIRCWRSGPVAAPLQGTIRPASGDTTGGDE